MCRVEWLAIGIPGHVMYEMATGRSLECAVPSDEQCSVDNEAVSEILRFIFHFSRKKESWLPITAHKAFKEVAI